MAMRIVEKLVFLGRDIKLSHSVFAMPFALLAAFMAANWLFARVGRPLWMPPVLMAAVILAAAVAASGIGYETYQQGARWLTVLLGPATVALGVPLYQQMHHIRALWRPILCTLPLAASLAAVYAVGIAWLMDAPLSILASLAPKSVTAPIAMGIAEQLGGSVALTLGGLLITGVLASVFVDWGAKWMKISDDRMVGFALGLAFSVLCLSVPLSQQYYT